MTDHDRAAARREITDALLTALERRHEVLDLIVEADDRPSAVDGIVALLGTSRLGAEAVIGMSFDQLTKDSRKKIAAELEDLNNILSFTFKDRPASSGDTLVLRPFSAASDRDIFAARTDEVGPLASFMPTRSCGCYYDSLTASTSCTACKTNTDCPQSSPKCNFGYCEIQ